MKQSHHLILALILSIASIGSISASPESQFSSQGVDKEVALPPIIVFKNGVDRRRYARLIRAVKRVYPLAKVARDKFDGMERHLETLSTKKERKEYTRSIYNEIKEEYTPILMKMTYTDGRVLIRLIDRETDYTAYEVLDEFRGGFIASLWQGVGRIFGHNLKDEYGTNKEDEMIERIIKYYEAGLL